MKGKELVLNLFPAPRKPLTLRSALPLILFLACFGAGCMLLEIFRILTFSSPKAFFLLLAMPWIWWLHLVGFSGLGKARSMVALLVRLFLIGLFVILLAEPRAIRKSDALSVVYALDLSDSIGEKVSDAGLGYITKTVSARPEKDEAGLVVFGRDAAVELPPRMSFPFEAINCRIAKDGTNLARGLSLAAAVLPQENQGRIVLISDGTQTEGNLSRVLDELKAREIAVDVLPIQYLYQEEVWLEKLELPRFVKVGETYEASIVLSSLQAGSGRLELRENGATICEEEVTFNPGKNRYVLPLYLREPGYYEYVAKIDVPAGKDGWQQNNIAINYLFLRGEGKVLLVTDPQGDERDWQSLVEALRRGRHIVELCGSFEFPRDALSLMPYDCVIFVNVPADAFDLVQLEALKDAVYHQGVGFLMVGGQNSFGPGGYHRTAVEKALPVTMDITQKKILPKGALVIVLHTCEFPEGNTWGKRIAKAAIRVLGARDEVGVLVYGQLGEQWLFPLTPAAQYQRLVQLINQAEIGDMPSFATTMQMALQALKASEAAMKHMIIISDGDPQPPLPALVKKFVAAEVSISISTVVIQPHDQQGVSVMKSIAGATGGRSYYPQDPQLLPSIFIKEAKTLRRSMIQNKVFTPEVHFPSAVLKGIDSIPELRGYVLTTPKPRATTILKGPETEQLDPLLATWRYGVGKTGAFTSDLSPNWAASWVQWDRYQAFVNQLITDISRAERASNLHMRAFAEGNLGIIVVEDFDSRDSFLEIEAQMSGPRRRSETIRLKQTGPRRYRGKFPLWGKGRYQIVAVGVGDGRSERAVGGFVVPYSPEYLRFRSNPIVLKQIAQRTGGRTLTGDERGEEIFIKERKPKESSRSVADWFLLLLACLVPLDVGVRRIQLDWYVVRGWLRLGRRAVPSGETLGALLRRKREIEFVPREKEKERRLPAAALGIKPGEVKREAPPGEEKAVEAKPETEAKRLSTTERLLAIKKRWKRGNKQ